MNVAVIIPTKERTEQAIACVQQLLTTAPAIEVWLMCDGDSKTYMIAGATFQKDQRVHAHLRQQSCGPVQLWNFGAIYASLDGVLGGKNADAFVLGADDLWFNPGWLEAALQKLESIGGSGLVGFNDLHQNGAQLATHFLVTRDYCVERWGGVFVCPHYYSQYLDLEATIRAQQDGQFVYAPAAIVEHRHPGWGTARYDVTYAIGTRHAPSDAAIFERRRAAGFPNDYPAVLT